MRYGQDLLGQTESRVVIDEVNSWIRRTGTNYNRLVTAAGVAPSTRSAVRTRQRRLTIDTADKLRAAMAAYPHGIERGEHKARVRQAARQALDRQRAKQSRDYPAALVDSSLCVKCGARRVLGCEHHPLILSAAPLNERI
ncbi:hypothetical protein CVO77_00295 [Sphingopyxis lindanitolerans]|uniref:Uncharacterized protein n=1 Tax=Sphingopyxis lindanitolerans TaxID=2054227 RepID=A0A2S8BAR9_9SPHN|nr:hypothetical protein [Sphingopyxis lindanitolerans]PQM29413.1 hypothetical protein CVO77_00295 [Sphingopyxis lindanitolerans]